MVSAPSMYLPPRFPPFPVPLCTGSGGHVLAKVIGLNSLCVPLSHSLFLTTFLFFELLSSVTCRRSLSVPLLHSLRPDLSVEQTVMCVLSTHGKYCHRFYPSGLILFSLSGLGGQRNTGRGLQHGTRTPRTPNDGMRGCSNGLRPRRRSCGQDNNADRARRDRHLLGQGVALGARLGKHFRAGILNPKP